jgi:hypothetical protein
LKRKTGTGITYSSANDINVAARDIEIGSEGTVYVVTQTEVSKKGYTMKKLGGGEIWAELSNTPVNVNSIGVNNIGQVWVSNLNGKIYSHAGRSDWIEQDGDANDISISSNNVVWIINAYG